MLNIKLYKKIMIVLTIFVLPLTLISCNSKKDYSTVDSVAFSKIERFYKIKKEFISLKKYKANNSFSTDDEVEAYYYHYEEVIYDSELNENRKREALVFIKEESTNYYDPELIFFSRQEDYPGIFEDFNNSQDNLLESFSKSYLDKFYKR